MIPDLLKNASDYSTGYQVFKSSARPLATCVTVRFRVAAVAIRRPPRGLVMV
jgi:hypothetical protein